ncbi:uncharacterized protein LODBEIA_P46380 [Lodderomyces beijingensis]|uniref:ATP synthase subunit K, mitochondrial n=1 Tax=Lodderomyces beijingensis TaxID=1775926 RepID=A0ABP0ZR79_9ASCO
MGAAYTIFGKQVPSYILSLATLGSVAAVAIVPQFVGSKETQAAAAAAPAAQTKEDDFDLEKLLKYVLPPPPPAQNIRRSLLLTELLFLIFPCSDLTKEETK